MTVDLRRKLGISSGTRHPLGVRTSRLAVPLVIEPGWALVTAMTIPIQRGPSSSSLGQCLQPPSGSGRHSTGQTSKEVASMDPPSSVTAALGNTLPNLEDFKSFRSHISGVGAPGD